MLQKPASCYRNSGPRWRVCSGGRSPIRKPSAFALLSPAPLPDEKRREVLADLDAYFARIDAKRPPVSDAEAEAVIDEALRSTRPHYRPIR